MLLRDLRLRDFFLELEAGFGVADLLRFEDVPPLLVELLPADLRLNLSITIEKFKFK